MAGALITVIIPSYRPLPLIRQTLQALAQQTVAQPVQIIVVDSSGDDTAAILAREFPQVTVLAPPERLFPGAARNRGIEIATGELIAFVDADAVPAPDWLERLATMHQAHPEWIGIGGAIANQNDTNWVARIAHLLEFSGYTPGWPERSARVIPTCNLSFKRAVFDAGARFLESSWGNEDVELVQRLHDQGQTIRFLPQAVVAHHTKTDFAQVCAHQRKLGDSTGEARVRYDLPGSWLARTPLAWLLTPAIKSGILWQRALTHETGALVLLTLGSPWVGIALWCWMLGFRTGAARALRERGGKR